MSKKDPIREAVAKVFMNQIKVQVECIKTLRSVPFLFANELQEFVEGLGEDWDQIRLLLQKTGLVGMERVYREGKQGYRTKYFAVEKGDGCGWHRSPETPLYRYDEKLGSKETD